MSVRLQGRFRAIYQPKDDSFVIHWDIGDGRAASIDIERQRLETGASPFARLAVHLKHRVSLQGVR